MAGPQRLQQFQQYGPRQTAPERGMLLDEVHEAARAGSAGSTRAVGLCHDPFQRGPLRRARVVRREDGRLPGRHRGLELDVPGEQFAYGDGAVERQGGAA